MENNFKAIKLSDDELENVSGGEILGAFLDANNVCAPELNDGAMEIVTGSIGIEVVIDRSCCAECGIVICSLSHTDNGKYYCDKCWAKRP